MEYCLRRIVTGRFWDDEEKPWAKTVKDMGYEILLVSQFTLLGKMTKGSKPDFLHAMKAPQSSQLFHQAVQYIKQIYQPDKVQTGRFGAMMKVSLVNDGPVTILVEKGRE